MKDFLGQEIRENDSVIYVPSEYVRRAIKKKLGTNDRMVQTEVMGFTFSRTRPVISGGFEINMVLVRDWYELNSIFTIAVEPKNLIVITEQLNHVS